MHAKNDVHVHDARESDFAAIARLDLTYESSRVLAIERSGRAPELTIAFRWRPRTPVTSTYAEYPADRQAGAVEATDAYFVAEVDGLVAGLLMIIVPAWPDNTGAGEITDLAVGREYRRAGVGGALLAAAVAFAQTEGLRALWVEPGTDSVRALSVDRSDTSVITRRLMRPSVSTTGVNTRLTPNFLKSTCA